MTGPPEQPSVIPQDLINRQARAIADEMRVWIGLRRVQREMENPVFSFNTNATSASIRFRIGDWNRVVDALNAHHKDNLEKNYDLQIDRIGHYISGREIQIVVYDRATAASSR